MPDMNNTPTQPAAETHVWYAAVRVKRNWKLTHVLSGPITCQAVAERFARESGITFDGVLFDHWVNRQKNVLPVSGDLPELVYVAPPALD